ncbi:glyoxalase superfamily protein [Caulobacter sp. UNC358MFTsu5.1]|uniref:glyoxalase superfamily protein n=1 Tax=Caulobacter sp. UNC358MFTsu5.1 TaxID=1449049 RepID=UPI0004A71939|nr:glyoxalase superfamily protein [Caulobacter sp. UNC358MFTsu5.1]
MTSKTLSDITFGRAAPGIFVRDIEKALAFYGDVLGFAKVFENGDPVGFVILEKDRAELHLSLVRDHKASTTNVAHLIVDDIDALHAICVAAGVRIIKSLADKDYGLRAFVFADLDGNRIDVGQPIGGAQEAPARFERRNLTGAVFHDTALPGATFDDINLSAALFSNVNLRQARFTNVNLSGVAIEDANIEGLTIYGIDIHALVQVELAKRGRG